MFNLRIKLETRVFKHDSTHFFFSFSQNLENYFRVKPEDNEYHFMFGWSGSIKKEIDLWVKIVARYRGLQHRSFKRPEERLILHFDYYWDVLVDI